MTALPAGGRRGPCPIWPFEPEIRLAASLAVAMEKADALRDEWSMADGKAAAGLARKLETAQNYVRQLEMQIDLSNRAEAIVWEELWQTPQAHAWEQMHWTREVAQYVRWKVKAEGGDLDASKEARQLADRLGLTPLSMLRLRWEVVGAAQEMAGPAEDDNVVELFG